MHEIEPYYNWRDHYTAEEDERSPFYQKEYNEFGYENSIYNYVIHPQWDYFGSHTLYLKIIFSDYEKGFAVLELIGEWNDCINNDIMMLKRDIIDHMIDEGINKFAIIGENVLNFHFDMDEYYMEWFDDVEEGWIAGINFREHVAEELIRNNLDHYIALGGDFNVLDWRTLEPDQFFEKIEHMVTRRIEAPGNMY